ncbi:polysaccharide deacetylase family protein [Undibacterium sp. Di24W]|uniref:polysaccharide deacetylase family protein n=1 Tax=Undibacterium sp. Di24W TaxID=3413033 RepID=UPI003BF26204
MNIRLTLSCCLLLWISNEVQAATCDKQVLGTSRTITLKREAALYGTKQHKALPLNKNEVVLTFDDGPSPENTPLVLKALADQCSKASFFMIGQQIERHPELAKRVVAAGHTLGLHSYSHQRLAKLSVDEQLADLKKAQKIYQDTFGTSAPAYRFPFLEETPPLLDTLKAKKMTVASIDLTIDDWLPDDTTEILLKRLSQNLDKSGGGIILMHDANAITAKAVPALLALLKVKGYKVVHLQWEKAS